MVAGIHTFFCNIWRLPSFLLFGVDFLQNDRVIDNEEVSDKELAMKMIKGDDHAFDELYERYFQRIYAFVLKRVGHAQTTEDIVSQVFMNAFASRKKFKWKPSFSAWIYRIATNAITDYYRTKKESVEFDEAYSSSVEHVEQEMEISILRKELEHVLEKIDGKSRMIISLKFYAQLGNHEIALHLNCSANNVGVMLHRALGKCEKVASDKLKSMMESTQN
ncbi:MAG: sigma-70 family RNA polymerase sigma factor [Patescibacteria group bacterium]